MDMDNMRKFPNDLAKIILCIESTENYELAGYVVCRYMPEKMNFYSVKEFFNITEKYFESINFPQSYFLFRSFDSSGTKKIVPIAKQRNTIQDFIPFFDNEEMDSFRGKIATFEVEVRFRCNAAWQGVVFLKETGLRQEFRSLLELIRIIDFTISENPIKMGGQI